MENASKALLIAGAILLAILIIGLGVFIYNQASNTVSSTGMDQIAVRQFNAQFEPYIKDNVSGITAMALYDTVQAYNATAERGRLITMNLITRELREDNFVYNPEFDEGNTRDIKMMRAKKKAELIDPGPLPVFEEGITFSKSELSTTKKYNIRVMEYDGGTIKVINVYLVRNTFIDDGEIIKEREDVALERK